jgi:exodeoxyribonuclease-3
VALHVRSDTLPEPPAIQHPTFEFEHRIVTVQLPDVTIASIYVPNGGKDFVAKMRFLEAMEKFAAECQAAGVPLVMCGDMNVARTDMDVHPKERRPGIVGQRADERALIERILSHGLVDVHRRFEPDNPDLFTWWAPWRNLKQRNIGWRLDYVFASEALAARATSCTVQREFGTSDHGPVIAAFDVAAGLQPRGAFEDVAAGL